MTAPSPLEVAAARLWHAWVAGEPCPPVRELIGAENIDAAYQVQRRNEARMVATGDRVVGRKIGLTSAAVQSQLGVDQPDFGPLFASRAVEDGGVVDVRSMIAPRIEAEIALIVGTPMHDQNITRDHVRAAISHAVAALEVVDSRVQNWDITIADTVADFASGAAFVLGKSRHLLDDELDLAGVPMTMWRDGEEVCSGTGAASMGDPWAAALWLARTLAKRGTPLMPGDVMLTGALGPFVEIEPGQQVRADLGPLGSVTCAIERNTS